MLKQVLCLVLLSFVSFFISAQTPSYTPAPVPSKYAHCENDAFPEPSCCGIQSVAARLNGRIHGGRETKENEFPWVVYIKLDQLLENGVQEYCAGSLINKQWVLSAAHCFKNPKMHLPHAIPLRFGEWNISDHKDCEKDNSCPPEVQVKYAKKIYPHKLYDPHSRNHSYDIALIRLDSPVYYSDSVQPICLLWDGLLDESILIGKVSQVAGWGHTEFNNKGSDIKMKTKVKVLETTNCSADNQENDWEKPSYEVSAQRPDIICAGGEHGVDSCHGDSGGPLMFKLHLSQHGYNVCEHGPHYQIGLVSYSQNCGADGKPGVYTRISSHQKWIRETVRHNS